MTWQTAAISTWCAVGGLLARPIWSFLAGKRTAHIAAVKREQAAQRAPRPTEVP